MSAHARVLAAPTPIGGSAIEAVDDPGAGHGTRDALSGRLEAATRAFEPIFLADAAEVASPDRIETKFLLDIAMLPAILDGIAPFYRILEIDGRRLHRYGTRYYDTADLRLYHAHRTGRVPRHKVRVREYWETGTAYAEIKRKTNRGRTIKSRILLEGDTPTFVELIASTPPDPRLPAAATLREIARVDYTRITLIDRNGAERVTFDLNLECSRGGRWRSFPGCVVAELKQERRGRTPALEALRKAHLRETEFSKYCVCLASLEPGLEHNHFKPILTRLKTSFSSPEPRLR